MSCDYTAYRICSRIHTQFASPLGPNGAPENMYATEFGLRNSSSPCANQHLFPRGQLGQNLHIFVLKSHGCACSSAVNCVESIEHRRSRVSCLDMLVFENLI